MESVDNTNPLSEGLICLQQLIQLPQVFKCLKVKLQNLRFIDNEIKHFFKPLNPDFSNQIQSEHAKLFCLASYKCFHADRICLSQSHFISTVVKCELYTTKCYGKHFMRTVGLSPACCQTTGNKQVSVPLNPASFTAFLITQLRGTNCDFSLQATDHNRQDLSVETHGGGINMLNWPFPWRPCRRATATGRRTSPPKPARRPATRRALLIGRRGSRRGAWAECAPRE